MIELSATAKINLNLRILGKRKDGFHDLETLMTCVDLADTLTVSKAGTLRLPARARTWKRRTTLSYGLCVC